MNLDEIKRQTNPFHPFNVMLFCISLIVVGWCWNSTEMGVGKLLDGWGNMLTYIGGNPAIKDSGFFPPDVTSSRLVKYLLSMLETVQMALLALIISVLIAFPLSFLASRNTLAIIIPGNHAMALLMKKGLYAIVRLFANFSRSINEIIWALLFVSAVGLGPMPGIMALGIHTSGVLIKLFSEGIETIQQEPIDALTATGAGFLKVLRYAVFPQITPFFVYPFLKIHRYLLSRVLFH